MFDRLLGIRSLHVCHPTQINYSANHDLLRTVGFLAVLAAASWPTGLRWEAVTWKAAISSSSFPRGRHVIQAHAQYSGWVGAYWLSRLSSQIPFDTCPRCWFSVINVLRSETAGLVLYFSLHLHAVHGYSWCLSELITEKLFDSCGRRSKTGIPMLPPQEFTIYWKDMAESSRSPNQKGDSCKYICNAYAIHAPWPSHDNQLRSDQSDSMHMQLFQNLLVLHAPCVSKTMVCIRTWRAFLNWTAADVSAPQVWFQVSVSIWSMHCSWENV